MYIVYTILLTKTTAAQNEVALCYHSVRGLYFLAVISAAAIYNIYIIYRDRRVAGKYQIHACMQFISQR